MNGRIGAMGQALVHAEAHIGCSKHFAGCGGHYIGHILAPKFWITIQSRPTTGLDFVKGLFKSGWGAHNPVFEFAALNITNRVQRGKNFTSKLAAFGEHGRGKIRIKLVVTGDILAIDFQYIIQNEQHVFGWGSVIWHGPLYDH